jgi:hypothetical protein
MKTITNIIYPAFALFAFACFALSPNLQAQLSPPPDGGYPDETTAEGDDALFSLTDGVANTALGFNALYSNTSGSFNVATGRRALETNDTGQENTALGASALRFNITGSFNTACGRIALLNNNSGSYNTALGISAMEAVNGDMTGDENTGIGDSALLGNTSGSDNTALGNCALCGNTSGQRNVGVGSFTGGSVVSSYNVSLGFNSGVSADGDNNIDIGNQGVAGESNTIRIGEPATVPAILPPGYPPGTLEAHTATYIAGIHGSTAPRGTPVFVNASGKLGTVASSARFKDEIKPMAEASEAILALKPVTFRYKKELDPDRTPQFGLVAEDVAKVNPDLVVRDAEGKVYTVRYEAVNAMLLNEFLKEHRKNQKQEATITDLKAEIATLAAMVKEQDAKIQRVNDKLELSKPAPQTVLNNR